MIRRLIYTIALAVSVSACTTPEATVTVKSGIGSDVQPFIACDVGVPNPDYVPTSTPPSADP